MKRKGITAVEILIILIIIGVIAAMVFDQRPKADKPPEGDCKAAITQVETSLGKCKVTTDSNVARAELLGLRDYLNQKFPESAEANGK